MTHIPTIGLNTPFQLPHHHTPFHGKHHACTLLHMHMHMHMQRLSPRVFEYSTGQVCVGCVDARAERTAEAARTWLHRDVDTQCMMLTHANDCMSCVGCRLYVPARECTQPIRCAHTTLSTTPRITPTTTCIPWYTSITSSTDIITYKCRCKCKRCDMRMT